METLWLSGKEKVPRAAASEEVYVDITDFKEIYVDITDFKEKD